jgi:predicted dehydrogenase
VADFPYQFNECPDLPSRIDYGIALVGAGGIVDYAHMPAYRRAGFKVVGVTDVRREAADALARKHYISTVYPDLAALLADPLVEIVDIAVPPWHQLGIVKQVAAAGKHMLCQKPLSNSYAEAVRIVQLAREAGVKLAVNQQMRWDAGMRVTRQLIDQGALGQPTDARIEVSVQTPWEMWSWLAQTPQLEVMFHSIHYLDSLRYLFGDPTRVSAFHTRYPGRDAVGETKTITVLEYESGLQVVVDVNHANWSDDVYAIFRFLGTAGIVRGTIGLMYDYPSGRPDTLEFQAHDHQARTWQAAKLTQMWIPDAFVGPMASLMQAIQTGGEALTSGEDNLKTLQVVNAAYRSAAEHRAVAPGEIAAEAR